MTPGTSLVFLDDDPTGVQALCDVPILLDWTSSALEALTASRPDSFHVLTNSRALEPAQASRCVEEAARAVLARAPEATIGLRGDSTLRGHVWEEYAALRAARETPQPPVLLLVPALPAAGRVTLDGVHRLREGGRDVPLHDTEYSQDGGFRYRSARLLEWAQERSDGRMRAQDGEEVPLARLRAEGRSAVAAALAAAYRRGVPAACAPDAERLSDLRTIADGFRDAVEDGVEVIIRCAPTFAGVLSGHLATDTVAPPPTGPGVVLICGSYVENTTRQLRHLSEHRALETIELDPVALSAGAESADRAIHAAVLAARAALAEHRVAVLATARTRPPSTRNLAAGMAIAQGLAEVARGLAPAAGVILAKGGITSAVVLRTGLGVEVAHVVGPVAPGVAWWRPAHDPELACLVAPGNVGNADLLTQLLDLLGV